MASSRLFSPLFGIFSRSRLHERRQYQKRALGVFVGQLTAAHGKGRSIHEWRRAPEPGRRVRHVGAS
jgi:hypothetical protein